MKTWLFQANPKLFDVDGYLAADLDTISWVVRQHKSEVAPGDTVFIWKSQGRDKEASGVIAECRVVSPVVVGLGDSASVSFWSSDVPVTSEARVELAVQRVASTREVLKRDWLKVDPVLHTLAIFRMAQSTNYILTEQQARRLSSIWSRTGKDWSWRESVAGLWAYAETKGSEVSKLSGSPVALAALATGRAVGGVYNKVMNFRALDPTDERSGLQGAGETDRKVWSKFFDSANRRIDRSLLAAEVQRLGLCFNGELNEIDVEEASNVKIPGSLEVLKSRYQKSLASGAFKASPPTAIASVQNFVRNSMVVEIARQRAHSQCEIPGCSTPSFVTDSGTVFSEIHHIIPLSEGGEDLIENAICLCPVHHREAHYGKERLTLRQLMAKVRAEKP